MEVVVTTIAMSDITIGTLEVVEVDPITITTTEVDGKEVVSNVVVIEIIEIEEITGVDLEIVVGQ